MRYRGLGSTLIDTEMSRDITGALHGDKERWGVPLTRAKTPQVRHSIQGGIYKK